MGPRAPDTAKELAMQNAISMPQALAVLWVLVGIVISLVLPVALRVLRAAKPAGGLERRQARPSFLQRFAAAWTRYGGNRYLKILAAATFVAVVLVFVLGLSFYTARDAALAGFAWESLINKLLATREG